MLLDGRPGLWELGIWAALHRINPWGELRADQRAAIGHALLAEINRDRDRRSTPFRARDFMPYLPISEAERAREVGESIAAAFSGMGGGRTRAQIEAWRKEMRRRGPRK